MFYLETYLLEIINVRMHVIRYSYDIRYSRYLYGLISFSENKFEYIRFAEISLLLFREET